MWFLRRTWKYVFIAKFVHVFHLLEFNCTIMAEGKEESFFLSSVWCQEKKEFIVTNISDQILIKNSLIKYNI